MSFYIRLDGSNEIELPNDKNLAERIDLCNEIVEKYPEYFEQKLQSSDNNGSSASYKTMLRLSIMADYLLAAAPKSDEYSTISNYKCNKINNNEITFSDFEGKYNSFR